VKLAGHRLSARRSSVGVLRPITVRMRHFRLWLLLIGLLSLVAEAVAAAAVFWRREGSGSTRQSL
jgi:hypothetical protein